MKKLIWISACSYLLIGLAHVMIGSIMPVLLEHYGENYSAGGALIFAQFAGFLIGVLVSPLLIARFGKRGSLLIALAVLGLAELAYTLLPAWPLMYGIGAFAGFGFGMIEAVIGTLVISAAADKAAVAMSRIEVAFGVGALLMPLISGWLIRSGAWRFGFLVIALFSGLMLLVWLKTRFGSLDEAIRGNVDQVKLADHESESLPSAAAPDNRKPSWVRHYTGARGVLMVLFVLFFFLYVGIEMGFVNFLPSMLIEKSHMDEATAAYGVTVFWLAMSAGRIYAGLLAQKIGFAPYILSGILVSLVFIGLFNWFQSIPLLFLSILVVGLFLSGIFSIALVYATRLLPGSEETTPSLLIASGGVGGAILPLILGSSMDAYGAQTSGWLIAGALAMLLVLGIILAASDRAGKAGKSLTAGH